MQDQLIALTGDKGGVGKSTLAILLAEWSIFQGIAVDVIDADPNQSTQTWVDKCAEIGYRVSSPGAPRVIVDTAGTSGSGMTRYIREAGRIVIPFQPHVADLETVVGWFLSLRAEMQNRVVFVPNRLTGTIEQRDGIAELRAMLVEEGRGLLASGLANRPAVYPPIFNGRAENFFALNSDRRVQDETRELFNTILGAWSGQSTEYWRCPDRS